MISFNQKRLKEVHVSRLQTSLVKRKFSILITEIFNR